MAIDDVAEITSGLCFIFVAVITALLIVLWSW